MQTTTLNSVQSDAGNTWGDIGPLLGRLLIGGVFATAGMQKLAAYSGTQGYMEAMGVPGGLLPLVIALEIGAGLALAIGYRTRLAALGLAIFTVLAAALFHANLGDGTQAILFMKNLMVVGGLLGFAAVGGGSLSLDRRFARLGGDHG